MTYSDTDIKRALILGALDPALSHEHDDPNWIAISPMAEGALQPASVDLRLGSDFLVFAPSTPSVFARPVVDLADRKAKMIPVHVIDTDPYCDLQPFGFVLASTMETVTLGPGIVGRVEGKSSLGRLGLMVHVTAGFIDPGFGGQVTLELFNASPNTIRLRPGLFICQMSFSECKTPAERPYGHPDLGSRYQCQKGVTAAKR